MHQIISMLIINKMYFKDNLIYYHFGLFLRPVVAYYVVTVREEDNEVK